MDQNDITGEVENIDILILIKKSSYKLSNDVLISYIHDVFYRLWFVENDGLKI
jgi:hypothetical protein